MRASCVFLGILLILISSCVCAAETARLPVIGVTIFKDGYAFVQHEGVMPVNEQGNVVLDELPQAVLGTFWSYSAQDGVTLKAVVAKRERVKVERTVLSLEEMIVANPGAPCQITEQDGKSYAATLDAVPMRKLEEVTPDTKRETAPERGTVVFVKTDTGLKALPLASIRDVTFTKDPVRTRGEEEFRNRLELRLDWGGKPAAATAKVGFMYLQKGLRWIPSYKADLDGAGKATLALQATLVNELVDFQGVPINLVVGVPNIAFRDMVDPMALQATAAQVIARMPEYPALSNAFSNAIVTQVAAPVPLPNTGPGAAPNDPDLGPDVANTQQREELFVFTVKDVSLKRGERMVLPVASYAVAYQDTYALDVPLALPPEATLGNPDLASQTAARLAEPKVMHRARLTNCTNQPLTTAPTLITLQGRTMAQSLMTYTAPGGVVDLDITAAVGIQVLRKDTEAGRTMGAMSVRDAAYNRVDMQGTLTLTSFRAAPVTVEVKRRVLGASDTVGQAGTTRGIAASTAGSVEAPWLGRLPWTSEVNGIAEVAWQVQLEPRQPTTLDHAWHYFWRN